MTKKNPAGATAPKATPPGGALGNITEEKQIPNSEGTHQGLHDDHESELHFGGDVHDDEANEEFFVAPNALAAPDCRPGFVQRWIRISLLGKSDGKNQSSQGQAGWRPRTLESVPGGQRGRYSTIRDSRTGGEFMVSGDLILCEMTVGRFEKMRDHFRGLRAKQENALEGQLAGTEMPGAEDHGFGPPRVESRRTRVTTRRPIVQADR